jgi:membrane-bound ClpP family serine protease
MFLIVWAALRSRSMLAPAGAYSASLPSGTSGVVRLPLEPLGSIYAGGEEWSAKTADGKPLERGTPVRVVGAAGLTVIVEPEASSSTS